MVAIWEQAAWEAVVWEGAIWEEVEEDMEEEETMLPHPCHQNRTPNPAMEQEEEEEEGTMVADTEMRTVELSSKKMSARKRVNVNEFE